MAENPGCDGVKKPVLQKERKKPYLKPELSAFGKVTDITAGGSGDKDEKGKGAKP